MVREHCPEKKGWIADLVSALEKVRMNKLNPYIEKQRIQRGPNCGRVRGGAAALLMTYIALSPGPAHAFVAAGDRIFPVTLILPQIAPTDEAYIQGATPFSGTPVPRNTRSTDGIVFFGQTLTDLLGITFRDLYHP